MKLIDQNLEYNTKIYHQQEDQYEVSEDLRSEGKAKQDYLMDY